MAAKSSVVKKTCCAKHVSGEATARDMADQQVEANTPQATAIVSGETGGDLSG